MGSSRATGGVLPLLFLSDLFAENVQIADKAGRSGVGSGLFVQAGRIRAARTLPAGG
jgi:hypothetical protein